MAGRDMKVSVLVQLVDRLTAPLRGITGMLGGLGTRIGDIGRRIGIVGGALAAISFASPIQQAAAWDSQLRDIAITAGKTGGAVESMIGDIGARYQKLAVETGQRSMELAKGAQILVASGMDAGIIDRLMPTIGKVATAAGATIEDTAKTAFALNDTLKIAPEQMEAALAKLVVAGKLGRFEFKNMAQEFPNLTAQMAKFGITGMEAVESLGASLQIAMLGTANPSEAATNLKNFLTKINAPEAIKKFQKELKVDVTGLMTEAAAKGINPVEAVIAKMSDKLNVPKAEIDKIMKKANAGPGTDKEKEEAARKQIKQLLAGTKVGRLYADMQVLDFLVPTLLNLDKLGEFKKEIKAAGIDVIAEDFASRMRGLETQMNLFGEIGAQVMRRVGIAFASNLPMANTAMMQLLQWTARIDAAWPGLIDGVLSWTGALLALGAGLAILTPVFSALGAMLGLVKVALLALLSPIGLLVAVFAGAATLIYKRWETFAPFFERLKDTLGDVAGALRTLFQGLLNLDFSSVTGTLSRLGPMLAEAFRRAWVILKIAARMALAELDKILGTNLAGSDTLRTLLAGVMGLSAAFVAALPVVGALGAAVAVFAAGLGVIFSPVTLVIAGLMALGAAGIYLTQNWEAVKAQLAGIWDSLKASAQAAWDGIKQAGSDAWEGAKAKGEEFASWLTQLPGRLASSLGDLAGQMLTAAQASGQALLDGVKGKSEELVAWVQAMPGRITAALGDLGSQLLQAGQAAIQGLWDGMKAKFEELVAWVAGIPAALAAAIGNIDIGSMVKKPEWLEKMSSWFGGDKPAAAPVPGAAGAGPDAGSKVIQNLKSGAAPASDPMGNPTGFTPTGVIGGSNGFATRTAQAANSNVQVGGQITVTATGGAEVTNVQSTNPAVPVTPNRGTMVGRV